MLTDGPGPMAIRTTGRETMKEGLEAQPAQTRMTAASARCQQGERPHPRPAR